MMDFYYLLLAQRASLIQTNKPSQDNKYEWKK